MSSSSRPRTPQIRATHLAAKCALATAVFSAACGDGGRHSQTLRATALPSPTFATTSRLPRFASGASAAPVLSWVEERDGDGPSRVAELRCASWTGSGWTSSQLVASGADWFVNWADFPALSLLDEKRRLAHWLQRSDEGRYDYSVQFVRSADGGGAWSAAERLHSDDGPGEHGFVSLVPLAGEGWRAVWLDGRQMAGAEHDSHTGAMALYTREISADGALGPESLLDARVCDCCPTAALRSADGAVWIAYRDRDESEVRDITLLRIEPGTQPGSEPQRAWSSDDGWKIAGCPVNGPALAAEHSRLAVAWFSMGRANSGGVHVAVSEDSGRTFAKRLQLAGSESIGRVDAVFDEGGSLVVSWLEDSADSPRWCAARLDRELRSNGAQTIALASGARDSGIGRLIASGALVFFAFTEITDDRPRIAVRSLTWH